MAVNDVYRPNVDYTLAEQVTSPISGKTAFIPSMNLLGAGGTPVDLSELIAAIGSPDDPPWNGTDPSASLISISKMTALNTATT
jgi:hypothetical protein